MSLLKFLTEHYYLIYNGEIAKKISINASILLGFYCSQYDFWEKENKLKNDGYFYSTRETTYEKTGLTKTQQLTALEKLEAFGIIKKEIAGVPAKAYYQINIQNLKNLLAEITAAKAQKLSEQGVINPDNSASENPTELLNKINNKNNKENINLEKNSFSKNDAVNKSCKAGTIKTIEEFKKLLEYETAEYIDDYGDNKTKCIYNWQKIEDFMQWLIDKKYEYNYMIKQSYVNSIIEDVINWQPNAPYVIKDYLSTLKTFIKRDLKAKAGT